MAIFTFLIIFGFPAILFTFAMASVAGKSDEKMGYK